MLQRLKKKLRKFIITLKGLNMRETIFKWHHCERKRKFTRIKNAENAIKKTRKKGIIVDGLNIYKCKYCEKYHIGHKK